jgi:response regulator RpfG family c-di-GMP phosphodiesterase
MPKFLLTGYADKENAIKAINDVGLYQYVEKTWENQDLKLAIQQGLEKRVLLEMLEKRID